MNYNRLIYVKLKKNVVTRNYIY